MTADAVVLSLGVVSGLSIQRSLLGGARQHDLPSPTWAAGVAVVAGWLVLIALVGGHRRATLVTRPEELRRVLTASLYGVALLPIATELAGHPLPRALVLAAFTGGTVALVLGRVVAHGILRSSRFGPLAARRMLVIGGPQHIDDVVEVLHRERRLGVRAVGAVTPATHLATTTERGVPVVGSMSDLDEITELAAHVDVVCCTGGSTLAADDIRRLQWALEAHDVELVLAPSLTDMSRTRLGLLPVGGLSLLHVARPRWRAARRSTKRAFDVVTSLVLLVLLSPLMLVAAICIKAHDRGPVLFRQTRIGLDGRPFGCLKLRTMVPDAERSLGRLQRQQGASALRFKMKDDPRITAPGVWLRRYSVDEIPQLLNVLVGDMSLVGPRPQVAAEVALYDDALRRRLRVRPGMTGLWQVSGRNDLSLEDAARLDLSYVDNWSMAEDVRILARTVKAVLGAEGAS